MTSIKITKATLEDLDILLLQKQSFINEADIYNDFDISPPLLQTPKEIEFSESLFLKAIYNDDIVGSVKGFKVNDIVFIKRLIADP